MRSSARVLFLTLSELLFHVELEDSEARSVFEAIKALLVKVESDGVVKLSGARVLCHFAKNLWIVRQCADPKLLGDSLDLALDKMTEYTSSEDRKYFIKAANYLYQNLSRFEPQLCAYVQSRLDSEGVLQGKSSCLTKALESEISQNRQKQTSEDGGEYSVSFWTAFFKHVSLSLYKRSPFSCDAYICHLELVYTFLKNSCAQRMEPTAQSEWFGLRRQALKKQSEQIETRVFSEPEFFRKVLGQTVDCFVYLPPKYHSLLFRINHIFYSRFLSFVPESVCMGFFNHLLPKLRLTKDRLMQGHNSASDTQVVGVLHLLGLLLDRVSPSLVSITFKSDLILDVLLGFLLDRPNLVLRHQLLFFLSKIASLSKKITVRLFKKRILPELGSTRTLNALNILFSCPNLVQAALVHSPKYFRRIVSQLTSVTDSLIAQNSPPSACECPLLYRLLLTCSGLLHLSQHVPKPLLLPDIMPSLLRFVSFLDASIRHTLDSLSNTQRAFLLSDYFDLLIRLRRTPQVSLSACSDSKIKEILNEIVKSKFAQHHNLREGLLFQSVLAYLSSNPSSLSALGPRLVSGLLSKVYAFLLRNPSWFSHYPLESFISEGPAPTDFNFLSPANLETYCWAPLVRPLQLTFLLIDFQELLRNNLTDFPSTSFFFSRESKSGPEASPIWELCNDSFSFCRLLSVDKSSSQTRIVRDCLDLIRLFLWKCSIKPEILDKFVDNLVATSKSAIQNSKGATKIAKEKCVFSLSIVFAQKLAHPRTPESQSAGSELTLSKFLGILPLFTRVSETSARLLAARLISLSLERLPVHFTSTIVADQLLKSLNMHEKVSSLACLASFLVRDCDDQKVDLLEPMLLNVFFKAVRSSERSSRTFADLILLWSFWHRRAVFRRFLDKNFRLIYLGRLCW